MKTQIHIAIWLLVGSLAVTNCKKKQTETESAQTLAQVSTSPVTAVTDLTALSGGSIISEGSSPVSEAGICWDTLPGPTVNKGVTVKSASTGNYTCAINGLKRYTTYFVRAYAINGNGTSYGSETSFRSADVWTKQAVGPQGTVISCLKSNGNKLYMGTNKGVFYSPDGGESWQSVGPTSFSVFAIAVHDNTIFAALSDHSIYRSNDNGATWTKVFTEISGPTVTDILIKDNFIFTCEYDGVYVSSNNGSTWVKTKPSVPAQYVRLVSCANTVYVLASGSYVYKTIDNGINWIPTTDIIVADPPGYRSDMDCVENTLLVSTGQGIRYSNNAGGSWNKYNDLPSTSMAISVSGPVIFTYVNTSVGLNISYDKGSTWTEFSKKGIGTISYLSDVLICDKSIYVYSDQGVGILYRYRR